MIIFLEIILLILASGRIILNRKLEDMNMDLKRDGRYFYMSCILFRYLKKHRRLKKIGSYFYFTDEYGIIFRIVRIKRRMIAKNIREALKPDVNI